LTPVAIRVVISRGGQGLPERRAPAGEPVPGTEAAGLWRPTRGKGEPASTRRQAPEGGSGRPGEGPPSQAQAEASNKMLWPLDSTRYPALPIECLSCPQEGFPPPLVNGASGLNKGVESADVKTGDCSRPVGYSASQSSNFNPMIGAKSRRLWVTRMRSCARAVAAIKRSIGGTFSPRLTRSVRMRP